MKYIKEFLIVASVTLLGEILKSLLPFVIPSPVYGLVLMFILLSTKVILVEDVDSVSSFLISSMGVMFVPPAVKVITGWSEIRSFFLPLLTISLLSTLFVFTLSAKVSDALIKEDDDE